MIGDPAYNMCEILTNIVNPLDDKGESFVQNMYDLKQMLRCVEMKRRNKIGSLDVKALYPMIPVKKALDCVRENWRMI